MPETKFVLRSSAVSLLAAFVACGGQSLNVGSDEAGGGNGSDSGNDSGSNQGGTSPGPAGGTGGASTTAGAQGYGGGPVAGASAGGTGASSAGGSIDAGGGSSPTGGTQSITSCTDEFPFAGDWRGNILDLFFEPLEELSLLIREESGGAGGFVGELSWGSGAPPPTATDPDSPPPGIEINQGIAGRGNAGFDAPWPGMTHTVVRGAGCDNVVRVGVSIYEAFESWCELQLPVYSASSGWGCMYHSDFSYCDAATCTVEDSEGRVAGRYPIWKCNLCGRGGGVSVCSCEESGCSFNPEPTHTFDLTLSADGNVLSGPDPTCSDCTVRLERVE